VTSFSDLYVFRGVSYEQERVLKLRLFTRYDKQELINPNIKDLRHVKDFLACKKRDLTQGLPEFTRMLLLCKEFGEALAKCNRAPEYIGVVRLFSIKRVYSWLLVVT
ncbi:hypothetical protein Tco_0378668, partial [Tanacetum coccineum]